jgi:asparagine synthase (glutamine-hydrolysing)
MFAFAVHDAATGSIALARDPLGIKPLYLLRRGRGLVFASELKAIIAALGRELRIDAGGLVASTLYSWFPEQRCAIEGVHKLPAGSWAEFHPDGSSTNTRYWNLPDVAAEAAAGPRPDLRTLIEESVAAHLVADVPVAAFLSGGLDSSIVTALAARHDPAIEAYTITFRAEDQRLEAMPDDTVYARRMAELLGIRLHEIEISPDVVQMLPRIAAVADEPIGDPGAINTLLMCEAARDAGVKVLLSGMGADELFGGYRKHYANVLAARYRRLPGAVRRGMIAPTVDRLPVMAGGRGLRYARWAKRFLSFTELPEEAAFRRSYTLYDPDELVGLIDPDLAGHVDALAAEHAAVYADAPVSDHVNRMCLADSRMFLTGLNLAYTDRASMAASTEVRVPFVDPVIARAAFGFSGSEKIRGREQKAVLKKAAEAWLPKDIIYRPKASFGAPLRAWVTNDLTEVIDDALLSGELVRSGFLQKQPLHRLVDEQRRGRRDQSKQIWQLLTLEFWYRGARDAGVSE